VPGGQDAHVNAPAVSEYVPDGQNSHAFDFES
jgi:hypothetical protein